MPFPAAFSRFSRFSAKLQQFDRSCNLFFDHFNMRGNSDFSKFREDWSVLKMLSESIHMLSIADAADLDGGEYLFLLALKIDAAVEEIANDLEELETHIKIEKQQYSMLEIIRPFVSCYGKKIKRLVAEIGEALDLYLSSSGVICCSWSFLAQSPPRPHVSLLLSFAQSVRSHLYNKTPVLIRDFSISKEDIDVLDAELLIISTYINDLEFSSYPGGGDDDDKSCRSVVDAFLSHFASVLVNFAIQSCNLIHRESTTTSDSLSPVGLLKGSHHQIDPTNPEFMEFHVNILVALNKFPGYQLDFVKFFCRYLIRDTGLHNRLTDVPYLIISFLDSSKIEEEGVVESFRQEITAVLIEIATLFEGKRMRGANSGPKSSELLTKICLFKAELCLREQIRKISSSSNRNGSSSDVISSCKREIEHQFYHILENLKRYSINVPHEKLENGKKILELVEQIHEESSSLFSSFQLKQITEEYKLKNSLLLLLLKIVLFKAESFLLELSLLNKCSSSSSSSATATIMYYGWKDKISLLLQLLEYFKQILIDQKLKDREGVYMPLVQIEIFARGMACFSYSFHPDKITEDVIRNMFLSSCEVLDKVKHLDSKTIEIGPQFPLSKSPKTYKLGFIDFLVRNLGELQKYDSASIAPGKHHIEELQLHLKSLTSFLRRVSESDTDKRTELKNLDDHITDIAYKLEHLIDSIEIDTQ